jgi:hypothetical protein
VEIRRARPRRQLVVAAAAGCAFFALAGLLLALPYLAVVHDHPEARRTSLEVSALSPVPESLLAAPVGNLLWGGVTSPVRERLRSRYEQTLFPGLAICLLAVAGMAARRIDRRLRISLAVAALGFTVLAFGFHVAAGPAAWAFPYRLLYEFAPGWQGLRTPGRLATFSSLALAVLAAYGTDRVLHRLDRGAGIAAALLTVVVVVEGSGRLPLVEVPHPVRATFAGPQLHLPSDQVRDAKYTLWSTEGFPELANGYSGFRPLETGSLLALAKGFPATRSADALAARGIRTVIVHGHPQQPTASGSRIAPAQVLAGDVTVYVLPRR